MTILDGYTGAWEGLLRLRASGMSQFDARRAGAAEDQHEAYGETWAVRLAFERELEALVRGLLCEENARRWRERFFARCCPSYFQPDSVDRLAGRLLADREGDARPDDAALTAGLRARVEEIVELYRRKRLDLRCRRTELRIAERSSAGDDRADAADERAEVEEMLAALEVTAVDQIRAVLGSLPDTSEISPSDERESHHRDDDT